MNCFTNRFYRVRVPFLLLLAALLLLPARAGLAQGDLDPPQVTAIFPPDNPTSEVFWDDEANPLYPSATFNEAMDPATLTAATFRVYAEGSALPEPGAVFYTATPEPKVWFEPRNGFIPPDRLAGGVVYTVVLSGAVTDLAGNPLGADVTWRFYTHPEYVVDNTWEDFSLGTLAAGCYLSRNISGELILRPALGEEFEGPSLSPGWTAAAWGSAGGSLSFHAGRVILDAQRVSYAVNYSAPRSLDGMAIFAATPPDLSQEQNVGLSAAPDFGGSAASGDYALVTAYNGPQGWGVYARTRAGASSQQTHLAAFTPGAAARFWIHWYPERVEYYSDNQLGTITLLATHNISPGGPLYLVLGDNRADGAPLQVGWLRLSPYASACVFTSRVLAAAQTADWIALYWMQSLYGPVGFETRRGSTPIPDGSWTAWMPSPNNAPLGDPNTLYIQYRATLATADPLRTPLVDNAWVEYRRPNFAWRAVYLPVARR